MEFVAGQIVTSRQGRDVNHVYAVVAQTADRLSLADGSRRTLAAPTVNNIRHVNRTNTVLPQSARSTDEDLRKALADWVQSTGGAQGG